LNNPCARRVEASAATKDYVRKIFARGVKRFTPLLPPSAAGSGSDLLISEKEGVMDCDAAGLLMGPGSPLLNLIGFLVFSAFALCAPSGSGGGGHHDRHSWPGTARVALTRGA
jgi:hypothetical protein